MALKTSPNKHIPWHAVLQVFGIDEENNFVPVVVKCPICGNHRLLLCPDETFGGWWSHCRDCSFAGDLIELSAAAWQISIPQAIRRLDDLGVAFPPEAVSDAAIEAYLVQHIQRRQRFREFVEATEADLVPHSSGIADQMIGLGHWHSSHTAGRRMGRFIIPTNSVAINKLMRPHVHNLAQATTGRSRVLPGKNWRDLLAVPFYDLPKRPCGFLLVGRRGDPENMVYCNLHACQSITRNGRTTPPIDAGLAMGQLLFERTDHPEWFGNTVFVLDVLPALRLQAEHLRDNILPLPVVGVYKGKLASNGQGHVRDVATRPFFRTTHFEPVFWSETYKPEFFEMTAMNFGNLYIGQKLPGYQQLPATAWLRQLKERAKPWDEVLREAIVNLPWPQLEPLLTGLDLPDPSLRYFIRECSPAERAILRRHPRFAYLLDTVNMRGHDIRETPDGWFLVETGEKISSAALKIDQVIFYESPDSDRSRSLEPWYRGRITCNGQEIPFAEKATKVERSTFTWMREKLAEAGITGMETRWGWGAYATAIAKLFCEPAHITLPARVGWSSRCGHFVLPRFMLRVGGRIVDQPNYAMDASAPARNLHPPGELDPQVLRELTANTLGNRLFWATMACLATGIFGPMQRLKPPGLGLIGAGASRFGHACAEALGCRQFQPPKRRRESLSSLEWDLDEAAGRHDWPVVLVETDRVDRERFLSLLMMAFELRDLIVDIDRHAADLLGMFGPWNFLECDGDPGLPKDLAEHVPAVLFDWLRDLSRRRLVPRSRERSLPRRILADMAEWLGDRGDPRVVREAAFLVDDNPDGDEAAARRFMMLLHRHAVEGNLAILDDSSGLLVEGPVAYRVSGNAGPPGVFISRRSMSELLRQRGFPRLDLSFVTEVLQEAGGLVAETTFRDQTGWLIDEAFWDRQMVCCRRPRTWCPRLGRASRFHRERRPGKAVSCELGCTAEPVCTLE